MKIKVCGMKYRENILQLLKLSIDYVGLIFYSKSPRYVKNVLDKDTLSKISERVKKVGVFVDEEIEEIKKQVDVCGLDVVQLHGNESPEFCERVGDLGVKVIKAFRLSKNFDFHTLDPYKGLDFFLFDSESGGSGKKFDWELLRKYDNQVPFFLAGGIGPDDAEAIKGLKGMNLYAVDLNSGFETEPGVKDVAAIEEFIESFSA